MLQVPDSVVFLRRPFSICRKVDSDTIELFYKKVGQGTGRLSELSQGEKIQVLGPLGKGFTLPKGVKKALFVAGGFGIAPFVEFAKVLNKKGVKAALFYGGRGLEDIQFIDEFKDLGVDVYITTEDGTLGAKGLITELLLKELSNYPKDSMIFCCGPSGMTESVIDLAKKNEIPAQVSYETYMGCGIGVCLGCAVKTTEGYKRACTEGPVFDIKEIWER
jgi:dihydroorotate dehydrogenase electron transfer subunit